ncbi:hypothetical protein V7114_18925 [Neobacillus niacini]|uniref:hypothetical protein n=1 Tax=Neobacillus niacini TaxID=86668 RepID=UPI0030006302
MASKKKDKKKHRKDGFLDNHYKDKHFVEKSYVEKPNVPFVYYDPAVVKDVSVFQSSELHSPDFHQTDNDVNDTHKESQKIDLQTVTEIQVLLKKLLSLFENLEDQYR